MARAKVLTYEFNNQPLAVEIGKWAQQANGSCLIRYGETVVLSTAVMSKQPVEADFLPLQVQVEERFYAAGKIPGGYQKREGKPDLEATLLARQIDRSLRPLFPKTLRKEVQLVNTVLAYDASVSLFLPLLFGSALALGLSDIPFENGHAGLEIYLSEEGWTLEKTEHPQAHLSLSGNVHGVTMIEGEASQCSEETLLAGLTFAKEKLAYLSDLVTTISQKHGKSKQVLEGFPQELDVFFDGERIRQVLEEDPQKRRQMLDELKVEQCRLVLETNPELSLQAIKASFDQTLQSQMRFLTLEKAWRFDGRLPDDIRELRVESDILPNVHGSAMFERGETQVLSVLTLASPNEAQHMDDIRGSRDKRFSLHYNFPSYAVGETGRFGAPSRRELGHGMLGERALTAVLPDKQDFPYTIRLVSEVLSSNGSSSQASICAGTLALMAGGVPIKAPVAGIAMGLVSDGKRYQLLTDISEREDHYGDMDFKVAGTRAGITAIQLDTKLPQLPIDVIAQALSASQKARCGILDCMEQTLGEPRKAVADSAPKISSITIPVEKIKKVIGKGGSSIDKIIAETQVTIDIVENGESLIYGESVANTQKAREMIADIIQEPVIGNIYPNARVTKLMKYGAFVTLFSDVQAFVHISEIAWERTEKVEDALSVGDNITVQLINQDDKGRLNASIKTLLPKPQNMISKEDQQDV